MKCRSPSSPRVRRLQQEVGAAAPRAIYECRLVDRIGARPHGVRRPVGRRLVVPGLA